MSAQQGGDQKKDGVGTLIVLAICLVAMVMMWPFYRPHVARMMTHMAVAESKFVLTFRPLLTQGYAASLENVIDRGTTLIKSPGVGEFKNIPLSVVRRAWSIPSQALTPFVLLFIAFAIWDVKRTDIKGRFRRRFTLDQLVHAQAHIYPHLRPILKAKPHKQSIKEGPWRIKRTYIEMAIEHELLRDGAGKLIKSSAIEYRGAFFDAEKARKVFREQMGKKWRDSLDDLSHVEAAMFGIMAGMCARDRKSVVEATQQMNRTWDFKKTKSGPVYSVDTSLAEALAKKHWNDPLVAKIRRAHAYFSTVMMALASNKLRAGELNIAHYIWLRPTDPDLFYLLHQAGLPEPNLEAAGPFVHYEEERRLGMAVAEPSIERAVTALKVALIEESYLVADLGADQIDKDVSTVKEWVGQVG